ncbi:hypothetical protein ABTH28_18170, partial [Acinetobacter baumannii]
MMKKQKDVAVFWNDEEKMKNYEGIPDSYDFTEYDSLARFTATHPIVMQERIARKNWQLELDTSKKKFSVKEKILYRFEKLTGIRLL